MLKNAIIELGPDKTVEELLSLLDETIILSTDTNLYSIAQIKIVINSIDDLRLICSTIKQASDIDPMVWAFSQKLFSTGISFADVETQTMIDSLSTLGSWPDDVKNKVKSIGIVYGKRYKKYSLTLLPSSNDIIVAKQSIVDDDNKADLIALVANKYNTTISKIDSGNITNWQDVLTFWGE